MTTATSDGPHPPTAGVAGLYRAFWRFAEGQRHKIFLSSTLLVGSQLVKLAIPWLAAQAINTLQIAGRDNLAHAGWLILAILATAALSWSMHGPGRVIERGLGLHVRENLADTLYARVSHLPLAWHELNHTGETQQRLSKATKALYDFAQNQFVYLQNAVNIAGPVIALTAISWLIGGVALVGFALVATVIIRFDRSLVRLAVRENDADRRYTSAMVDALGNVSTVIALRLQKATRGLLATRLRAVFEPLQKSLVINEAKWCSVDLMTITLAWGLVGLYAVLANGSGEMLMLGNVFMVHQYANQAGGVIGSIASNFQNFARMQADYATAEPIWSAREHRRVPDRAAADWASIDVHGLDFRYASGRGERPSLDNVALTLRRAERVALVGPSGSGKSTLMRVLAGLYDADRVRIAIDGIAHPHIHDLADIATLVPQDAEVFEGTFDDNLAFGLEHPGESVRTAIRVSGLDAVLAAQPQGLQTLIAERGANLSGGQKQRIGLARGMLAARASSLVFFDEPTSSLDAVTEARFLSNLSQMFPDACIVASVHRLNLLPRFDRVVFMVGGRVVDTGSVDELLDRQPAFGDLWRRSTESATGDDPGRAAA